MSQTGEFRLCSGCGEWAIWTPQYQRGSVFCCQACARGRGCDCAGSHDEWSALHRPLRDLSKGGHHALRQPVSARIPQA